MKMKTLTLHQPWATLVILGAKKIETRTWGTQYRGPLAIHASKTFPGREWRLMYKEPFVGALKADLYFQMEGTLPTGAIIGTCELTECWKIKEGPLLISEKERAFGDYRPGRYMYMLDKPLRWVMRVPAKGKLGLWEWDG